VHKATELAGMNVKNVSDQSLGEISDLGIDLQSGRVAFAILKAGGLGAGGKLYAVPPNAFTAASDNQSLVANIDKEKLANAPQVAANNWQQLSDAAFAARVYQYYGKQPYWSGTVSPTGGAESRVYKDQNRTTNSRPASQKASGEFASVEEAKRLIGMNVENARGADVAKLNDIVVDLESGRAIYALVDLSGRGGIKAVPSSSLMLAPNDKSLRFTGDQAKLNNAPALNRNANVADAQFAERVYTHFGEDHAWFDSSRNFATAHKVTDLMKMKVENVQNQNVGQVQNLMVDLPNARVLYVILSAAPIVGNGNSLFALPPNAFTASEERKTLVSDLDKAKLEGAPRFNRTNLRELANPAKAAEIYQYYGKQAYWDSGNLAPTGREQGRENE
jgi:sporulation protein YlmC with PRC-barrel domain